MLMSFGLWTKIEVEVEVETDVELKRSCDKFGSLSSRSKFSIVKLAVAMHSEIEISVAVR